jgi:type IV pilus assembly protein PilC
MPVFIYTGRKLVGGERISGEETAVSRRALAGELRNQNVFPIDIHEKREGSSTGFISRYTGARAKNLALFSRQFSVMLSSGVPLVQCLSTLVDQQDKSILQKTLRTVRADVESGSTLADAMDKHPRLFDRLFVSMVAAGEASGALDLVLGRLTTYLEKAIQLRRSLVSAAVYPAVLLAVTVIVVFVIMAWVVPVYEDLFDDLKVPLPILTQLVIASSEKVKSLGIPLLLVSLAAVSGLRYFYSTDSGQLTLDRLLVSIPILGPVLRKVAIARFSLTLSTLLSSGIPLLDAIEITAGTVGNRWIETVLLKVRSETAAGATLAGPMKQAGVFPSMVIQIISIGEQTGELAQMLERLAVYYGEETDSAITILMTLLEPLLIVVLGIVVGSIVVSMYLPIVNLIGHLAGGF